MEVSWLSYAPKILLTAFVLAISLFDLRQRRIPNFLVFPAAFLGLFLNTVLTGWNGLWFSFKGLVVGFCLLIVPYAVQGMKAGDVKFLAAIGTFLGAMGVFRALLLGLLFYPLQAAIAVLRERKLQITCLRFCRVFFNFLGFFLPALKSWAAVLDRQDDLGVESVKTPYGVALAVGSLLALYTSLLGDIIR